MTAKIQTQSQVQPESTTFRTKLDDSRLRVLLLVEVRDGEQERFLQAYERMRDQVSRVPGHLGDQLCQSIEDPSQWLITSEWESASPYLAWVNSPGHLDTVEPLSRCIDGRRSLRFRIVRETREAGASAATRRKGPARRSAPPGDGVVRAALTFTVKPGSEPAVAEILGGYASPNSRVNELTRLHRTSLYMHGNRVVRAVEVVGDLSDALRHVAAQPEIRAAEEALDPHLEQERDLSDPASARDFFRRAALPCIHHVTADPDRRRPVNPEDVLRRAFLYPVRPGCGAAVARLLAREDRAAAERRRTPLIGSTVFQRGDTVVRLVDVHPCAAGEADLLLGVGGRRAPAMLRRLADFGASRDASTDRLVAACAMDLLTDRSAQD